MALGRPIGAKLFLEGKEVPLIGATITCTVGQASIAYVDVVPHKSIIDIKPRTRVELFVRNFMMTEAEQGASSFPYVLAWKGEVFGINFGKTAASRSFSLSCIDHTSYWDNCLCYFFNAQQTQSAGANKSSQAKELVDIKHTGEKVLLSYLSQASYFKTKIEEVVTKDKGNFLDAIIAIYKDIGFVNEFFKLADQRLRIADQIVMKSSGVLSTLLKEKAGMDWFTGIPNNSSGYSTLRMVLQDLMSIIFHDFVSVPFPASTEAKGAKAKDKNFVSLPTPNATTKTIGNFIFKPNLYMMPPPACNIFFPDEYSNFQFSRNFFKEPTRLIYMPELPARFGQGGAEVYLPHTYEPASFSAYMKGPIATPLGKKFQGDGDFDVPKTADMGVYGSKEKDSNYKKMNSGTKKDYNFLTNEEFIKGVWLYRESMMPATNQFRASLDQDYNEKSLFTQKVAKYLFYKRRFQDRSLQITSHLKLSVMPGFPVLIMDDSDSYQNVIAYCSSVTHRIYATEGGYTNVQLSYARYVEEQSNASSLSYNLLIPPWFSEEIFGAATKITSEVAQDEVKSLKVPGYKKALSDFYKTLLGEKGYDAITSLYENENTLLGSVKKLVEDYKEQKKTGSGKLMNFISSMTSRDYIKMRDYYKFYSAETESKNLEDDKWITFTGDVFTRKGSNDHTAAMMKTAVIDKYIEALKYSRGFRG